MSFSISSRPNGVCEDGHGAYRSQMPDARILVHELRELRLDAGRAARARGGGRAGLHGRARRRPARGPRAPRTDAGRRPPARRCWSRSCCGPRDRRTSCPVLSLAGGIAAVECARAFGASAGLSWPNDVVCERRKLGGRARRARPRRQRAARHRHEPRRAGRPTCPRPTASCPPRCCSRRAPRPERADRAGGAARARCGRWLRSSTAEGPPAIAARARPLDALAGTRGRAAPRERRRPSQGEAAGIADDGSLLVRVATGVRPYASGEVVRLT